MSASMMTMRSPRACLRPCRYAVPECARAATTAQRQRVCAPRSTRLRVVLRRHNAWQGAPRPSLPGRGRSTMTSSPYSAASARATSCVPSGLASSTTTISNARPLRVTWRVRAAARQRTSRETYNRLRHAPALQLAHEQPDDDGQVLRLVVRRQDDGQQAVCGLCSRLRSGGALLGRRRRARHHGAARARARAGRPAPRSAALSARSGEAA